MFWQRNIALLPSLSFIWIVYRMALGIQWFLPFAAVD